MSQITRNLFRLHYKHYNTDMKRRPNFVAWKGHNTFFCHGRLMTGSHSGHLLVTASLTVVTWMVFMILIAPFIHAPIVYFISLVTMATNLGLLVRTAFTDPGIIPRGRSAEEVGQPGEDFVSSTEFCSICNVARPLRAKHCRYCNNCVEVLDHHCPVSFAYFQRSAVCASFSSSTSSSSSCTTCQWTGTCIGARNYFSFSAFLWSLVLGLCFMLWCSALIAAGWLAGSPTDSFVLRATAVCVMVPWCVAVLTPVCALMAFHVYLGCSAKTTNEYFKEKRSKAAFRPAQPPPPTAPRQDFAVTLDTAQSPATACFAWCTPRCANEMTSHQRRGAPYATQSTAENTDQTVSGSKSWRKLANNLCGQNDTQIPPMWENELVSENEE